MVPSRPVRIGWTAILACMVLGLAIQGAEPAAAPPPESLQDRAWQAHMRLAKEAFQRHDYAEAEAEVQAAVKSAQDFGPQDERLIGTLSSLVAVYAAQAKYADAESPARRVVEIQEKVRGAEDPEVAVALNDLAKCCKEQGKFAEAEPLYKRALAIIEKAKGPQEAQAGMLLSSLGELYRDQGKLDEADRACRRALAIREKACGPCSYFTTQTLHVLGTICAAQGKLADAEAAHRRALDGRKKSLGWNRPVMMESMAYVADACKAQGKFGEAETLYKQALAMAEVGMEPGPAILATVCEKYADLLRKAKRDDEAAKLEQQAKEARTAKAGPSATK